MKISLSSLCIITLLLCSCTAKKTDDAYYDYYNDDKNYISTSRVRPVFYSSGFAAEGNDYYYISKSKHKLKDVEDRVYQTPSVPSRYIVDIDAKWQSLFGFVIEGAKERGIKKNISTPVIDRFFVKLYDIETKELEKTVNVKKLINNLDEVFSEKIYNDIDKNKFSLGNFLKQENIFKVNLNSFEEILNKFSNLSFLQKSDINDIINKVSNNNFYSYLGKKIGIIFHKLNTKNSQKSVLIAINEKEIYINGKKINIIVLIDSNCQVKYKAIIYNFVKLFFLNNKFDTASKLEIYNFLLTIDS